MSWFKRVFGFAEHVSSPANYAKTQGMFEYTAASGILKSNGNGREFQAGTFTTPSVDELRSCRLFGADALREARNRFPGVLTVREVVADVAELHCNPANHKALFMVASQFNCLEFASQHAVPEKGIACYSSDRTQGPACAIACAPGTVVRNYFGVDGEGQTTNEQIQCLAEVEKELDNGRERYFYVQNGYSLGQPDGLRRLGSKLSDTPGLYDSLIKKLRIGVMKDTEVTCKSFGSADHTNPEGHTQLVSQTYCSACAVGYSSAASECWEPFAKLVLDGAYEATLHAACLNALENEGRHGSKKVFLTALGGGVFGNDLAWIVSAMDRAFHRFEGIDLEVAVVSYGSRQAGLEPVLRPYGRSHGHRECTRWCAIL